MQNPKWNTPASKTGEEFEMIAKTFHPQAMPEKSSK